MRGEIEQMEGRLRYLTNRTDFTTITISAREEENYVPPAAPTFTNQVVRAWNTSLAALQNCGEQIVVGIVYVFPWLAALSVVALPALLYFRKHSGTIREAARVSPPQH